jgi:hypothetical protein
MKIESGCASSVTSPVGRGRRVAPGEGLRPNDRSYPLTPTLSHSKSDISDFDNDNAHLGYTRDGWEREHASIVLAKSIKQKVTS